MNSQRGRPAKIPQKFLRVPHLETKNDNEGKIVFNLPYFQHFVCRKLFIILRGNMCRLHQLVTIGGAVGAKPHPENFSPPLEKCVGHSLKILDIVQEMWAPRKTLHPSCCPKLVTGLGYILKLQYCTVPKMSFLNK